MTRLLFVDNKKKKSHIADIPVVQDNAPKLPDNASRSAKRKRPLSEVGDNQTGEDLPRLSKTYLFEVLFGEKANLLRAVLLDNDKPTTDGQAEEGDSGEDEKDTTQPSSELQSLTELSLNDAPLESLSTDEQPSPEAGNNKTTSNSQPTTPRNKTFPKNKKRMSSR